jgi:FkbM family methyltransferase
VRLPFGARFRVQRDELGAMILRGEFENRETRFVERFLKPGMTVLDIGANQGYYTLLASQRVGTNGRVVAFEPSPREREALEFHLRLNSCSNVSIEALALSDYEGDADLYLVKGKETGLNSLKPPAVRQELLERVRVEIRPLDNWLDEQKIERVDFVKLDVEGAELSVLKGAAKVLGGEKAPVILIEVANIRTMPWGYKVDEIIRYLRESGYELFEIEEDGSLEALREVDERERNLAAFPRLPTKEKLS